MNDQWTDRLSEYLDEELAPRERAAFEAHLTECPDCSQTLEELRQVARRAGELQPRPPDADLWPGIAARVEEAGSLPTIVPFKTRLVRRFSFTVPQLVAAGLALMVLSGGAVWVIAHGGRATSLPSVGAASRVASGAAAARGAAGASVADTPDASAPTPVSFSDPRYEDAVADLEQALNEGRSQLDPQTIRVLEANLQAIDRAIEQSRQALAADPANVYLHNHLAEARQRKLALLRRAADIVNKG